MIPQSITLQNFLSYGSTPQTVSFDGYNLICLSGKNGHGKSALLDAITWSVWGQARKTVGTNKPDEGLLRLGSRQMVVVFECLVNGQRYRIRREYSRAQGKPQATLDVGVFDEQLDEYRSLTEKTIRRTQAVIEEVIGLDYETYINSAFLRQGHANEFSQKSPKERKKILANILGVNRFDGLQSFALEKARECTQQIRVIHELQAQDEQIIATREQLTITHAECEQDLTQRQEQLTLLAQRVTSAQRAVEQYNARQEEYVARKKELDENYNQVVARREAWRAEAMQWREENRTLNAATGGEEQGKRLTSLRSEDAALRRAQQSQLAVEQELIGAEKQVMARQRTLEQQQQKIKEEKVQRVHSAQAAVESGKAEHELVRVNATQSAQDLEQAEKEQKDLHARIKSHEAILEKMASSKKMFDKRRAFYAAYVPRAKWLYEQQQELGQKSELVNHKQSSSCPLCEQILSAKRKHFLHDKLQGQVRQVAHQYARLHKILGALKQQLVTDHETVKRYDEAAAQIQALQGQLEQVVTRLTALKTQSEQHAKQVKKTEEALKKATEALEKAKSEVALFETAMKVQLQEDDTLVVLAQQIGALKKKQQQTKYDKEAHQKVEQEIVRIEQQQKQVEQLREKVGALKEQRAALTTQRLLLKKEYATMTAKRAEFAKAGVDADTKKELDAGLANALQEQQQAQVAKEQVVSRISTVKTKLEQVAERQKAFDKRAKECAQLEQIKSDYSVLATAWSKNGIQALLIEQAIPEIEQEANELLARLSQNQAQVFIESQRDLKSGGVRETLDIKISDTMGVRPYEMFSGGEAFRIDFALRIAISKLLARRAGTALQVLIIDEGFGSQDEEGLQRLMQSLYAVQEDFEKIIIVSHLAEFKENFPVHFVVSKNATGSHISVEQRG